MKQIWSSKPGEIIPGEVGLLLLLVLALQDGDCNENDAILTPFMYIHMRFC